MGLHRPCVAPYGVLRSLFCVAIGRGTAAVDGTATTSAMLVCTITVLLMCDSTGDTGACMAEMAQQTVAKHNK